MQLLDLLTSEWTVAVSHLGDNWDLTHIAFKFEGVFVMFFFPV